MSGIIFNSINVQWDVSKMVTERIYPCGDIIRESKVPVTTLVRLHTKYCSKCKSLKSA